MSVGLEQIVDGRVQLAIQRGSALDWLDQAVEKYQEQPQLVCIDPPYNIGRNYDSYQDNRSDTQYLSEAQQWLTSIHTHLHPHGSLWIAIYDNLVSELDVLAKQIGFHKRGHIIWGFTFGVNQKNNFTRSKTHLLYYTRHKTRFTFNADDAALRVPSARQLFYNDRRANAKGRLPDDVWLMYPQPGDGDADVWVESRVCGTFHEKVQGFDNQMPLAVLDRIVRATSHEDDLVCDVFGGTFSTAESAINLGRRFIGCDISARCVGAGSERLSKLLKQRRPRTKAG